jgi:DNA-binding CsgD family transcriptional regulator
MTMEINSESSNGIIGLDGVYLYSAFLSGRQLIWSAGNPEGIFGRHSLQSLKHPLEYARGLHHPKDREKIRNFVLSFGSNGCNTWAGFYRIKHSDGHWVWIYSKVGLHPAANNGEAMATGLVIDVQSALPQQPLSELLRIATRWQYAEKIKQLTPRELMIIKLIAEGQCYKDIAGQLFIQPDTVNKHRKNILHKLGLKNIAMLACFAKEAGLV